MNIYDTVRNISQEIRTKAETVGIIKGLDIARKISISASSLQEVQGKIMDEQIRIINEEEKKDENQS